MSPFHCNAENNISTVILHFSHSLPALHYLLPSTLFLLSGSFDTSDQGVRIFQPPPPLKLHPCPPVSPWSASLNRASFSFVSNSSPVRILLVFALFQQYFFFLCVPCLVLWRLSFLIGIALRLLSSSACSLPFLHPSSLFSASLAEEDRHQTVWSRVCVCAFMHGWCVCSEFLTSFLYNSMFLVMSPPL